MDSLHGKQRKKGYSQKGTEKKKVHLKGCYGQISLLLRLVKERDIKEQGLSPWSDGQGHSVGQMPALDMSKPTNVPNRHYDAVV